MGSLIDDFLVSESKSYGKLNKDAIIVTLLATP